MEEQAEYANAVLEWHVERMAWEDMIPYEKNARKIKAENKRNLNDSIDEFGMAQTITLDFDNVIIGGHKRRETMLMKGFGKEQAYVMKPNRHLSESEFKKLNLILNSDKYSGDFDVELLNQHFSEFDLKNDFGVDIPDFEKELSKITENKEPEFPIVPKYSEKYAAVVIVIENSIDENFVRSVLGLDTAKDYKTENVGDSYVLNAKKFIEKWQSR